MHILLRLTAALVLPFALAQCGNSEPLLGSNPGGGAANPTAKYDVQLTRTALGIPHVKANRNEDFGSMGYGLGYAFAEDNLCVMQDDFVTIQGRRAEFFGRDGSYTIPANDSVTNNVDSDFFWRQMATTAVVDNLRAKALPELRLATTGFADGYNRYIRQLKAGGFPGRHAACRAAPWLFEISDVDMYRRYYRLSILASSSVFSSDIGKVQPPATAALAAPSAAQVKAALARDPGPLKFFDHAERAFGSNMYALGKDATESGVPMVFGNPHFPWSGTERLYISHLTVPGRMDIMGSSLYGLPAILIGFNNKLAWSHTVSTAFRFTLYQLTINPANPLQYLYDGAMRDLEATPHTIKVKEADGSMTELSRTLYRSQFGPMMGLTVAGLNILPWTNAVAYTLRDANAENDRLVNQFALWDQAKSLTEFKSLQKTILGVPWVNTIASGPGEKAYYADVTVVPNVTDAQVQTCSAQPLSTVFAQLSPGLPLLDGSRVACEWATDADAPAPGIFGPGNLPVLERDDFVGNFNDSYWLTNPAEPVTGFNRIIGDEASARSLRTRLANLQVLRRLDGSDGRPGNKFNIKTLQDTVLGSSIYSAELARDAVVASLCALPAVIGQSGPVQTAAACAALEAWDGKANLDSRGAHLWREFWKRAIAAPGGLPVNPVAALMWTTPFSAADAVNTPNGLNVLLPTVQAAFADAITAVTAAGFAFDAPMGTVQFSGVNKTPAGADIAVFGGTGGEGAFTIVSTPPLTAAGYRIDYGNSYIQTVTWDGNGPDAKVQAEGFITYSQSTDPANPHYSDFTQEYAAKRWHRFPFAAADVAAQKVSEQRLIE